MNARIQQNTAVAGIPIWWGSEVINTPCFDVDRGDFSAVVFGEDGEFDGSAPGVWFEDGRDIVIPWPTGQVVRCCES